MTDQTDTDALVARALTRKGLRSFFINPDGPAFATHLTAQAAQIAALTERDRQLCELVRQLVVGIMEAGVDALPALRSAAERTRAALETER